MEVLATLTSDVGRILSKMHLVQPKGNINFITGVRIAHVSMTKLIVFCVIWPAEISPFYFLLLSSNIAGTETSSRKES